MLPVGRKLPFILHVLIVGTGAMQVHQDTWCLEAFYLILPGLTQKRGTKWRDIISPLAKVKFPTFLEKACSFSAGALINLWSNCQCSAHCGSHKTWFLLVEIGRVFELYFSMTKD